MLGDNGATWKTGKERLCCVSTFFDSGCPWANEGKKGLYFILRRLLWKIHVDNCESFFLISFYNMSWISSIGEITQKKNFTIFYFLNRCIEKKISNHLNFKVCVKFGHCFCLFGVFRPTRERFTHIETSLLPVKGLHILTYARHSWPLRSEGSLACHIYCNMHSIH